jgi:hypothetical protein
LDSKKYSSAENGKQISADTPNSTLQVAVAARYAFFSLRTDL